jgi:hypothetical protein
VSTLMNLRGAHMAENFYSNRENIGLSEEMCSIP